MTDKKENKYWIEKVLHEWIRDLPEVRKVAAMYEKGHLTPEDALAEIVYQVKQLKG